MKIRNALICLATTLCLIATLVGAGLVLCLLPPTTTVLSHFACQQSASISAFSAEQLAQGAQATRDYTVGNHDLNQLLLEEADINVKLYDTNRIASPLTEAQASTLRHAVDAKAYGDSPDYRSVSQILTSLDERFALDSEAISHLDDVYYVVVKAEVALGIIAALAVAGLIILAKTRRKLFGAALTAGGVVVLVVFAAAGAWAAVDFYQFFNVFHSLFFANGSWLFSYDSLLICMLPEPFWMGMGALWLATTVLLSVTALVNGAKNLRK